MKPSVEPLSDVIGVRIDGIDLSETLSVENFDFVYKALVMNKVIAFSGQTLSPSSIFHFLSALVLAMFIVIISIY